jgi:hypothetical protein
LKIVITYQKAKYERIFEASAKVVKDKFDFDEELSVFGIIENIFNWNTINIELTALLNETVYSFKISDTRTPGDFEDEGSFKINVVPGESRLLKVQKGEDACLVGHFR